MKKQFSIPAVLASTVLMIAASTIQAGAAPLATIIANPPRPATISVTPASGQVALNEVVSISVDFPSSGSGYSNSPLLTLEHDSGTGVWTQVAGQIDKVSASAGTYTFSYPVPVTEKVRVKAKDTPTYATVTSPEKQLTVVPSTALLDPIPADGKSATAHFTPVVKDKATQLQVQEIYTYETNETDPVTTDPAYIPGQKSTYVGPWKTIASSKQNASGDTTFSISNPLEVKHKYRAVSGATTNIVEFAAPLPSKNTGLPQLHVNTNEGDTVNTRTRYFEGEFVMTAGAGCSAVPSVKKSVMKGRGNYSWSFEKKGYTLKLGTKKDLCGMGTSKKWALIANHYDKSLLRNMVAYNLGQKFTNLAWTPKAKSVDFYMNGSYLGTYMLVERIAIQGSVTNNYETPANTYSPRVNIDELKSEGQTTNPAHPNNTDPNVTGGYILEWDFRKGADYNPTAGGRGYVGVKDPENDLDREGNVTDQGISSQQKTYINKYLDDTDAALFGSSFTNATTGWRKYIDENSAVDYYLAMEFLKPVDGNMWASVYMYKPRSGKLKFGPLWDFDLGLGSANRAGNVVSPSGWYLRNVINVSAKQSSKTWFNRLNEDASFRAKVDARWNELYDTLSSTSYIDQQKGIMAASAAENYKRWSYSKRISSYQVFKSSWSADADAVKKWMSDRRNWLNGQY